MKNRSRSLLAIGIIYGFLWFGFSILENPGTVYRVFKVIRFRKKIIERPNIASDPNDPIPPPPPPTKKEG